MSAIVKRTRLEDELIVITEAISRTAEMSDRAIDLAHSESKPSTAKRLAEIADDLRFLASELSGERPHGAAH